MEPSNSYGQRDDAARTSAARLAVPPAARVAAALLGVSYVFYVAMKALIAPLAIDQFPEALLIKAEALPHIFPLHMVTGAAALVLAPVTAWLGWGLRRHFSATKRTWHRWLGRISAFIILVSGLTALPVALFAPVHPLSGAGFAMQAALWLYFLTRGLVAIRRKERAVHQYFMLLMVATTSGALFFRVFLALWSLASQHELADARLYRQFYAADAWAAWALPLTATLIWLHRKPQSASRPPQSLTQG